jgi:hypothetical protein
MNRRGFLKGVIGGVTATGLVVTASADEIAAFAAPLKHDSPVMVDVPSPPAEQMPPDWTHLYNSSGQLVALVKDVKVNTPRIEVTSAFDNNRLYIPGLPNVQIVAEWVAGPITLPFTVR